VVLRCQPAVCFQAQGQVPLLARHFRDIVPLSGPLLNFRIGVVSSRLGKSIERLSRYQGQESIRAPKDPEPLGPVTSAHWTKRAFTESFDLLCGSGDGLDAVVENSAHVEAAHPSEGACVPQADLAVICRFSGVSGNLRWPPSRMPGA